MKKKLLIILLIILLGATFFYRYYNRQITYQNSAYLSTSIILEVPAKYQNLLDAELWPRILEKLEDWDKTFSLTNSISTLSKFNEMKAGERMVVEGYFLYLYQVANTYYQLSDGYFDITVYPLVAAYGFGASGSEYNSELVKVLKPLVGFENIILSEENGQYYLSKNASISDSDGNRYQMAIDFGALLKGFIAQELKDFLISEGIEDGHLSVGVSSQIVWGSYKADLYLKYEDHYYKGDKVSAVAIGVAGDSERYIEIDNIRYCHIINPKTLLPINVESEGTNASLVTCGNALEADIMATLICINPDIVKSFNFETYSYLIDGEIKGNLNLKED